MAEEFVPGPLDPPDAVKPAAMPPLHDYVLTYAGADFGTEHKTLRGRTFSCTGETFAVYDAYHDANDPTVLLSLFVGAVRNWITVDTQMVVTSENPAPTTVQ
jgi:hypothetical protein